MLHCLLLFVVSGSDKTVGRNTHLHSCACVIARLLVFITFESIELQNFRNFPVSVFRGESYAQLSLSTFFSEERHKDDNAHVVFLYKALLHMASSDPPHVFFPTFTNCYPFTLLLF